MRLPIFLSPLFLVAATAFSQPFEPYSPEPHSGAWPLVQEAMRDIHRTDFQIPAVQWTFVASGRGRLPTGWGDWSSDGADARYVRIVDDGVPQLQWTAQKATHKSPARAGVASGTLVAGESLRIAITLRSPGRTPATVAVFGKDREGAPLWSAPLAPSNGWTRRELYWNVPKQIEDAAVVVVMERNGTLEISDFVVQTVAAGDLDRTLAAAGTNSLDKNLVRATRFPLGLPPRWMVRSTVTLGEDLVAEADPGMVGPSGSPALKLDARSSAQVMGEPFAVLRSFAPHVASIAVRGSGGGELAVCTTTTVLASARIKAGDEWRRIAVPFVPRGFGDELHLRFQLEEGSTLWFDALRVGVGADATEYAAGMPAEVSLAALTEGRLVFADEPAAPVVRWAVSGAAEGARLRAKVVNLYGRQLELPAVELSAYGREGTWTLPEFPGQPLGSHRFEAWVEGPGGERLSAHEEIVVHRLPRPRRWGVDAEDSPFGAHVSTGGQFMHLAKAMGVNWVRFHDGPQNQLTGWFFLERDPGEWAFNDAGVRRYREQHLMILGQLGTAPAWASALQRVGHQSWTDRYYQPENMDAYRNYVRVTTARYRDEIRHWDVWNEPWLRGFWKKDTGRDADGKIIVGFGDDPAGDFARLQRATYDEAKAVDPELVIVGFNTTGGNHEVPDRKIAGEKWTRMVRDGGGVESSDVISYHQYAYESGGYPGDSLENGYQIAVRPLLDEQGRPPRPVWMTEGNVVQHLTNAGFYHQSLAFPQRDNDRAVADRLCRYLVGMLRAGAEKIFLYSMHKMGRHFDNGEDYRVLLSEDGQLHPTGVAYAAFAWRVEGKRFREVVDATPDTRAYVFTSGDEWTLVMAPRPGVQSTVNLTDYTGHELADIFGNPLPADAAPGERIFYVSGRGAPPVGVAR